MWGVLVHQVKKVLTVCRKLYLTQAFAAFPDV